MQWHEACTSERAHEHDAWWNGADNAPRSIKLLALKKLIERKTVIARVLLHLLLFYLPLRGSRICREKLENIDQSRARLWLRRMNQVTSAIIKLTDDTRFTNCISEAFHREGKVRSRAVTIAPMKVQLRSFRDINRTRTCAWFIYAEDIVDRDSFRFTVNRLMLESSAWMGQR